MYKIHIYINLNHVGKNRVASLNDKNKSLKKQRKTDVPKSFPTVAKALKIMTMNSNSGLACQNDRTWVPPPPPRFRSFRLHPHVTAPLYSVFHLKLFIYAAQNQRHGHVKKKS
jgi:hypothetical protein